MLVFIFSLISIFSPVATHASGEKMLADTIRRPSRNSKIIADSTGKFLQINRIFIVGNRVTRDPIILRELTLQPGDYIYSTELPGVLETDKRKLINTRLFNTVTIRTLELEPNKTDILIDITERWYTFPSPIFDLADRNFNEWWQNYDHDFRRVNYGLRLYQYNMRGRNETLRLIAQFGFTRRFGISYRFPYIDRKKKQGLSLDFDFGETKNLSYRTVDHKLEFVQAKDVVRTSRSGSITYNYRPSFFQSHSLSVGYKSISINDTIAFLNPNYLKSESDLQGFTQISYQFTADHRDYVGYPLRGYHLVASITRNGISESEDLNKTEITGSYSFYKDLTQGFYLSNNTVGYWSSPNDLPYYNYSALGYQKQFVRGYEVYIIEGPQFFLNKTTFKKKIFSRTYHWGAMPVSQFRHIPISIYLKTYTDVAYVNNYKNYEANSRLTNKWISGFGGGVDIVGAYDFVLRLEYTINAEGNKGFFFNVKKEF
jgi:outer membrane protein assembly factor BamA